MRRESKPSQTAQKLGPLGQPGQLGRKRPIRWLAGWAPARGPWPVAWDAGALGFSSSSRMTCCPGSRRERRRLHVTVPSAGAAAARSPQPAAQTAGSFGRAVCRCRPPQPTADEDEDEDADESARPIPMAAPTAVPAAADAEGGTLHQRDSSEAENAAWHSALAHKASAH